MSNFDPLLWRKPPLIWRYGIAVLARCRCTDHFAVAVAPPGNCSGITVSLRRHGQCVAWRIWAGITRVRFSILAFDYYFLEPKYSFGCKA